MVSFQGLRVKSRYDENGSLPQNGGRLLDFYIRICYTNNENTLVFYDKSNKVMPSYVRLCALMKTIWINKVRKREVKSGYKILFLEIHTKKPID